MPASNVSCLLAWRIAQGHSFSGNLPRSSGSLVADGRNALNHRSQGQMAKCQDDSLYTLGMLLSRQHYVVSRLYVVMKHVRYQDVN